MAHIQEVNLFLHLPKKERVYGSAADIVLAVGLVIVIMIGAAAYASYQKSSFEEEFRSVAAQETQLLAQVQALAVARKKQMAGDNLEEEIRRLQTEKAIRDRLLRAVTERPVEAGQGFSGHMQSLARQIVADLWLTRIQVKASGREVALEGAMLSPELLPRYLQALQKEEQLQGQRFDVFRLKRNSNSRNERGEQQARNPVVEFELRSRITDSENIEVSL